jgi:hypothetical protein
MQNGTEEKRGSIKKASDIRFASLRPRRKPTVVGQQPIIAESTKDASPPQLRKSEDQHWVRAEKLYAFSSIETTTTTSNAINIPSSISDSAISSEKSSLSSSTELSFSKR